MYEENQCDRLQCLKCPQVPHGRQSSVERPAGAASYPLAGIRASLVDPPVGVSVDRADKIYHLDSSERAVIALVARLGSGALDRLLNVLCRDHAKHDGDSGVE